MVCNNTSTSKLVYDYISGFHRENDDGSTTFENGRLGLFRNFDEYGNPYPLPRTLLIDSHQLESGDALDSNFRKIAAEEIDRFRRDRITRTGDREQAEKITDQELLREVMNTVGKPDQLGASIRCVVSVSMLTEGWDANTVSHVLGVRAFGTQLLCEQVVGRALRRQSYDLNDDGLFDVEYADVLGIPFDFTAKPVSVSPRPPRETVQVRAVRPERDELEIYFPRVAGYRVELPEERLTAEFNEDSVLELTPDMIGPSHTTNQGIIGEGVDLNLVHTGDLRPSTLLFHLTRRLLYTKWRDPDEDPKLHLFGQLKSITKQWLDGCLDCKGGTYPAQLMYQALADIACERITAAITREQKSIVVLSRRCLIRTIPSVLPRMSTSPHLKPVAGRPTLAVATSIGLSSIAIGKQSFAAWSNLIRASKRMSRTTISGWKCPTAMALKRGRIIPDFIVLIDDGRGEDDLLHLIVEIKGYRREDAKEKKTTMDTYWVPGVNNHGRYGRWAFAEFTDVYEIESEFEAKMEAVFDEMIEQNTAPCDSPSSQVDR